MAKKHIIARKARMSGEEMVRKQQAKGAEKKRDYENRLRLAKAAREARLQSEVQYKTRRAFSSPFRHLKPKV